MTYCTQRSTPSHVHQVPKIAVSFPAIGQRQMRAYGSTYLRLHQFTLPKVYRLSFLETGKGLMAYHQYRQSIGLVYMNISQWVCKTQPPTPSTRRIANSRAQTGNQNGMGPGGVSAVVAATFASSLVASLPSMPL